MIEQVNEGMSPIDVEGISHMNHQALLQIQ
jgi:hypothetical protein